MNSADFKSGRVGNFFIGIGLVALAGAIIFLAFASEEQFLGTRTRRGGFLKIIEQMIGWELFVILMLIFCGWVLIYAFVSFWKALDGTPDVVADSNGLAFHPSVKRDPVSFDEVHYWALEFVSKHPVVTIYLKEPYWSLQGLFRRKSIKLEGGKEELEPLFQFFMTHPEMRHKLVRR